MCCQGPKDTTDIMLVFSFIEVFIAHVGYLFTYSFTSSCVIPICFSKITEKVFDTHGDLLGHESVLKLQHAFKHAFLHRIWDYTEFFGLNYTILYQWWQMTWNDPNDSNDQWPVIGSFHSWNDLLGHLNFIGGNKNLFRFEVKILNI